MTSQNRFKIVSTSTINPERASKRILTASFSGGKSMKILEVLFQRGYRKKTDFSGLRRER